MPYYKCCQCHHEFEYIPLLGEKIPPCDWCGCSSHIILEEKTPLEKMSDNWKDVIKVVKGMNNIK